MYLSPESVTLTMASGWSLLGQPENSDRHQSNDTWQGKPILTYLLMELRPSWEAANCAATQEETHTIMRIFPSNRLRHWFHWLQFVNTFSLQIPDNKMCKVYKPWYFFSFQRTSQNGWEESCQPLSSQSSQTSMMENASCVLSYKVEETSENIL
jgi:hypothetical protein